MRTTLAALAVLLASPVGAQDNCGNRQVIIERLADRYGESRQAIGLGTQNRIVETFANRDTGSWTITVTLPSGEMCLLASGHAFEVVDDDLVPTGKRL